MSKRLIAALGMFLTVLGVSQAVEPLLYLPMDAGTRLTTTVPVNQNGMILPSEAALRTGRRREGWYIESDCLLPAGDAFPRAAGTLAFWIQPTWSGNDDSSKSLFNLYGKGKKGAPGYLCNRWNIHAAKGRLSCTISSETGDGPKLSASSSIADWKPGEWHHIALTWQGINSGKADASLQLYVDGRQVSSAAVKMDVGAVAAHMGLGRDMDDSPDYAKAVYDDVYLYGSALSAEQIRYAVEHSDTPGATASASKRPLWPVVGWTAETTRFRTRLTVDFAGLTPGTDATVKMPVDIQADLDAMGLADAVNPGSMALFSGAGQQVPFCLQDGALYWNWRVPVPAKTWLSRALLGLFGRREAPGQRQEFVLYLDAVPIDFSTPLVAQCPKMTKPAPVDIAFADYATQTYNDPWDFNEGDQEGIDQWGDKDYGTKNQTVADGILQFDAFADGWFVWGNIWGQVVDTGRTFAVDVDRYPVLEMRLRQNVENATWKIFGKFGEALMHKDFEVNGRDWQTVSVDLKEYCRWSGTMSALRIDTTEKVPEAHIEIDWIRLVAQKEASRSPIEVCPFAIPYADRVAIAIADNATAGTTIEGTVRATDVAGNPVSDCPVRLALTSSGGGKLSASSAAPSLALPDNSRRLVTGPDGSARFLLDVSPRAGSNADRLRAVAEFADARSATATPRKARPTTT